jgi:hypothetical protein
LQIKEGALIMRPKKYEKHQDYNSLDFNEKLIGESSYHLNSLIVNSVYCFTEEQAKEIVKRCRYKCEIEKGNGIIVVKLADSIGKLKGKGY